MQVGSGYACNCRAGWAGYTCEKNIQECKSQPCSNGGKCADEIDGYTCYCPLGFSGSNCDHEINECASSPCKHGTCTDGPASFVCDCATGWSGNTCEENIDNCIGAACFHGSLCVDHLGGYTCSCAAGFRGDDCSLHVDECASDPCANGGQCIDSVNAYNCTCEVGFEGTDCDIAIDACSADENDCLGGCIDECIATGPSTHVCANLTAQAQSVCILGGLTLDDSSGRRRLQLSADELHDATGQILTRMVDKLEAALCPVCGFARGIAEMVGYDLSIIDSYKSQMVSIIQGVAAGHVQAGYDSLSGAFSRFTNDNIQHFASPDDNGALSAASAKSFSFEGSFNGISVAVTFYLFLLPGVLQSILDGLIEAAASGDGFDWSSVEIEFAVKFVLTADDFNVASLPAFASVSSSWLRALQINGQIDLVLSSTDITAQGEKIIEKGFSFAGIVSDSPTSQSNAPFMATLEQASSGQRTEGQSIKYLQGYLPLDVSLGGVSWDSTLGGGWAQLGFTNMKFAPEFLGTINAEVFNAYVKVEGFGSDDFCGDEAGIVVEPAISSQAECETGGNTWTEGAKLAISFFADFDLDLGLDDEGERRGRLVGKVSGLYTDMSSAYSSCRLARAIMPNISCFASQWFYLAPSQLLTYQLWAGCRLMMSAPHFQSPADVWMSHLPAHRRKFAPRSGRHMTRSRGLHQQRTRVSHSVCGG
eukprot:SAG31_NODE_5442_length_2535_cov_17.307471_1_plen_704_part_10